MPASRRPSVDLPAPDGPTTATRSPGSRSRSMPCSTSRSVDVRVAHVLARSGARRRVSRRSPCGRAARARCRRAARTTSRRPGSRRATRSAGRPGRRAARRRARPPSPRRASRAVRDEPAAPGERGRDREHVGELGRREPDRAQVERAPLGPVGLAQVGVDPADALLVQAERLERAATFDRLADGAGERRVRGALPQVALRARASGTSACRTRAPARRRCTAAPRAG